MSTTPATTDELQVPPDMQRQINTAHTLFFSSVVQLLRMGFDPAVVAGTLMDCLAHILAQRPPQLHQSDLESTSQTIGRRVTELATHLQNRPPIH